MALIICKECQAEVSSKAAACPKCGAPIKAKRGTIGCGGCIMIFLLIGGLGVAVSVYRRMAVDLPKEMADAERVRQEAIAHVQSATKQAANPPSPITSPASEPNKPQSIQAPAQTPVLAAPPKAVKPAAAGELFKLEFTIVPPNGVYVRPTGLKITAPSGDPRYAEVEDAIKAFARTISPGCDVLESSIKPSTVQGKSVVMDVEMRAFTDTNPNTVLCTIGLTNPAPKAEKIDALTSAAVDLARCIHPGKHVSTIVCLGDDAIDEQHYSGNLFYDAVSDVVGPAADRNGGYRKSMQKERYLLVNQKHPYAVKNLLGKFFYSVEIVYRKEPATDVALRDLVAELASLARTVDGDVHAYAYVGMPNKDPPWRQLVDEKDSFKRFLGVQYSAKTGIITSRDLKVKLADYKDPGP